MAHRLGNFYTPCMTEVALDEHAHFPACATPVDAACAKNVQEIADLYPTAMWDNASRDILTIGPELDPIAVGKGAFTTWQWVNIHLMRTARPQKKAATVGAARNEGPYLVEWLAHHRVVGFDHAFIYTNNNTDGSDAVLELLHAAGIITLIRNVVGASVSPQKKAYQHSIQLLRQLREYEWVGYFDFDELLVPDQAFDFSVRTFLDHGIAKRGGITPGAILLHWDWFGSDGIIHHGPGLMSERFTLRKDYACIKPLVHLPSISEMDNIHVPDFDLSFVNSAFDDATMTPWVSYPVEYSGARLHHYFQRSFAEFANKHFRGLGDTAVNTPGRDFDTFFMWDPVAGTDGTRRAFPQPLLDRVKAEIERLLMIPGLREAVSASEAEHAKISAAMFGDDIVAVWERLSGKTATVAP